ncbi:PDZ domain-containing protein GIPC1 [Fragariocoptes setiger]|uniref:PDZ domain-containing protein GIPC1 n=1 Tax=Fragariocoptes setiger TaxID=1670756 RepID=A0ABQ7S7M2_9ACAR|nr:PDZ domain-containing protein GIPC1 [Fragariocoptes setiger]
MEFECKLAHQDTVRRVSSFASIKELYKKIADQFNISPNDIIFCTLNTNDSTDMTKLLANCLSLSDIIVAHCCDYAIDVELCKTQPYLGLTITDNGFGRAFVKKIRTPTDDNNCIDPFECSPMFNATHHQVIEQLIKPGDHIESINGDSMLGLRHFEVAKALKAIPINTKFTMRLVRPKQPSTTDRLSANKFNNVWPVASEKPELVSSHQRESNGSTSPASTYSCATASPSSTISSTTEPLYTNDNHHRHQSSPTSHLFDTLDHADDLAKSSLPIDRLLAASPVTYQFCNDRPDDDTASASTATESAADKAVAITAVPQTQLQSSVKKINQLLESFIGISDNQLALQIYRMASQYRQSPHEFLVAMKSSDMQTFGFSDDFTFDLWASVSDDAQAYRDSNSSGASQQQKPAVTTTMPNNNTTTMVV